MISSSTSIRMANVCSELLCSAIFYICILLPCARVYAVDYYVTADGNDNYNGKSLESAWRTLQRAADSVAPGDTVLISPGHYRSLEIRRSGMENKPISFKGIDPQDPPVISGNTYKGTWQKTNKIMLWRALEKNSVSMLKENNILVLKDTSKECLAGRWYWEYPYLYFCSEDDPNLNQIWTEKSGGGINLSKRRFIIISNIILNGGMGVGISIKNGSNNRIEDTTIRRHRIGIEIVKGNHNVITNANISENREGIYLYNDSSDNIIENCHIFRNGTSEFWPDGDRHAVAFGGSGKASYRNITMNSTIEFNGGPPNAVAAIAYHAPYSVFSGNVIRSNFGSPLFITIKSDHSIVSDNLIEDNGHGATQSKTRGVAGLSVRGSTHVRIINNTIVNNSVSAGSYYTSKDKTARGVIDIREAGNVSYMPGIIIKGNKIDGSIGGPDIYTSPLVTD